ncbi:MAE_28990/MAE_18760 family HEPN-like nuclease [Aphanizomenon flos-aquae]|uniref:MAE-28990/MAE-18760-like HEPN domain-containing protein n=1 Tax=Aphanizomenon flos-aquae FACHB-1040 TaxID=2692887 RepID=A0ABR8BQQ7_APHFL|nr:MAE_28990/MAE_18760 family HEPN-like nuclease [Aphanizomenon flos-aquae]MBD2276815.1 hypothetical protein [Aphanizomenon flos-aquae FACHB-1040]
MGVGFQIPIKNLVSILISTAVKTARVASLSGLKTLSFPLTARSYEKLLKTRNEIAHGEDSLTIDRKQYIELQTMVMEMLEEFRNRIENAAINQDFLLKN